MQSTETTHLPSQALLLLYFPGLPSEPTSEQRTAAPSRNTPPKPSEHHMEQHEHGHGDGGGGGGHQHAHAAEQEEQEQAAQGPYLISFLADRREEGAYSIQPTPTHTHHTTTPTAAAPSAAAAVEAAAPGGEGGCCGGHAHAHAHGEEGEGGLDTSAPPTARVVTPADCVPLEPGMEALSVVGTQGLKVGGCDCVVIESSVVGLVR